MTATSVYKVIGLFKKKHISRRVEDLIIPPPDISWDISNVEVTLFDNGGMTLRYKDQIRNLTPEAVQDLKMRIHSISDYFKNT